MNTYSKWGVVAILSVWISACDDMAVTPEASGKVVNIAFVGNGSSEKVDKDQDILEGILAANAADPMLDNGDRLEIIYLKDTNAEDVPARGIAKIIDEYIKRDHVSAVLLGADSKDVLQAKQNINALGVPTLAVIATNPGVTDEVDYISQLSYDDERQAQSAALFVLDELLLRSAAVWFDEADPYSSYLAQVFRTTFERAGGRVDAFSVFSGFNQTILERLKTEKTQVLYIPLGAKQVFQVLEALKGLDWSPDVMAADGLLATVLQNYPDRLNELNGVYVTDVFSHKNEFVSLAKFVKRLTGFYDQMFSDLPSTNTALGVEAYQVVKVAINLCPDPSNKICVNRHIRSLKNHQGIISKFSINADGRASRPIFINTIQDGQLELVVKVN